MLLKKCSFRSFNSHVRFYSTIAWLPQTLKHVWTCLDTFKKIQMQIKAAVDPTAANGRIVTSVMLVWSLAPGVAVAL